MQISLALVFCMSIKLYLMDVKYTFLNEFLNGEVYVEQSRSVEILNFQIMFTIAKVLNGFKRALRAGCERLTKFLSENNFKRGLVDFIKTKSEYLLIISIYN